MTNCIPMFEVDIDQKYGAVIRCVDRDHADYIEDFLVEEGIENFSVRFSEKKVEMFLGKITEDHLQYLYSKIEEQTKRWYAGDSN